MSLPTMPHFKDNNVCPSCRCGLIQQTGFKNICLLSVFPGQVFSEKPKNKQMPGEAQKQLEQEEEEVGGRKLRRWRLNRLQEER